jgi:hypothetical protein
MIEIIVGEDALPLIEEFLPDEFHLFLGGQPIRPKSPARPAVMLVINGQAVCIVKKFLDFHENHMAKNRHPSRQPGPRQ